MGDKKIHNFNSKYYEVLTVVVQDEIIDFARTQVILKLRLLADSPIKEVLTFNNDNTSTDMINISNNYSDTDSISSLDKNTATQEEQNSQLNKNNHSPIIINKPSNIREGVSRKFHSSAYLFDSKKSNDLSIAQKPIPLASEELHKISNSVSKNKYNNSLISYFLGSIQHIVAEAANSTT